MPFYVLITITAVMDWWQRMRIPILMFTGAKLNAIGFYHLMEFTSSTPPKNLVPYFSAEGPYLVAIALVAYSCVNATSKTVQLKQS